MGGGNGNKAKLARERNAKTANKGPTSNLGTNEAKHKCKSCFVFYLPNQRATDAMGHLNTKHKGQEYQTVFQQVDGKGNVVPW